MSARVNALMVAKWGVDLVASTMTAAEADCPHRASVYRAEAFQKIAAIRAELVELETELGGPPHVPGFETAGSALSRALNTATANAGGV